MKFMYFYAMNLQRLIEPNWTNQLYAVFAEEKDNDIKINALQSVKTFIDNGAVLKKVEDRDSGAFVGVEVYLNGNIVYSKFRKSI